jgi:hypothetical protein
MLAWEHGVTHLQIFGYSLIVIQWMKQEVTLRNFMLQPLFLDVLSLQSNSLIFPLHMSTGIGTI